MSTTTASRTRTGLSPLHPAFTAPLGAVVFAVAMAVGEVFDLNADAGGDTATSVTQWVVTGLIALVGLAIGLILGLWAWSGDPGRLARTGLGAAVGGGVLFVAFWSGWPSVLSAVAVGLALEHRRRIGSFGTGTVVATGLGVLTFVATAIVCVVG